MEGWEEVNKVRRQRPNSTKMGPTASPSRRRIIPMAGSGEEGVKYATERGFRRQAHHGSCVLFGTTDLLGNLKKAVDLAFTIQIFMIL